MSYPRLAHFLDPYRHVARRIHLVALLGIVAFACTSLPALVRADGVADEAEVNFRLGAERYQAGDYRSALAYFLASNRLAPNRHVRFNIAKTFERLRQYPEAYRWYQDALVGEDDPNVHASIEDAMRVIEREVAVIEVRTSPPGATVFLDRRDLGAVATTPSRIAVAPGRFRVIVHLDGYEDVETDALELARGSFVPLELPLARIVGHVDVAAREGTEVRVDGDDAELACVAPCRLDLSPGMHVLYFHRDGFRSMPRQIQVSPGQALAVRVDAAPVVGSIVVTSDENNALVEVDGVSAGFTPVVVPNVAVGERHVRVSLNGFETVERTVVVEEDHQTDLRGVVLQPSREVTTASRVAQSIDDAPASVSVISAQELAAFRYPTIAESLRGQRGVALNYDGVYSGVAIRGLGQPGDYGNRVLILNDGATLNDNIVWQSYVGYDGRVDLGDVDHVELVRGPGSVLYGTGAVTGVVNLIPKAMPGRTTGEARASTTDTRTVRGRGSVSVPLGTNGGISLSASGAHSGGETVRLDGVPAAYSPVVDGYNRFNAGTTSARLEYKAVTLQAFFTSRLQRIPNGAYGTVPGDYRNEQQDTRAMFEARYEPRLGRYVTLYTRAYANMYRFAANYIFSNDPSPGTSLFSEKYKGTWFGAEARVVIAPVDSFRISVGGEVQVDTKAQLHGDATDQTGSASPYLNTNDPYRIYAGYALAEWRPVRAISFSAGVRADAWSTFGATANPRIVAIIRPTSSDIVKLMAGRAFRAPSIYELQYNDGGQTQVPSTFGGNKLGPERLWSSEIEYTHKFSDGWSALASGHFQRASNFIGQTFTDPTNPSSTFYFANQAGTIQTLGADAEIRRDFRAGWMVSANYGYLSARFGDAETGGGSRRVPNAPNHYASLRGIAPLGVAGLRLAFRATLEAPRRISTETTATTPTAVVADLVLSGEVARFGLDYSLGLYNLFDYRYVLPVDPSFLTKTMPQQGRTLLAMLGIRF